jgi:hypothetical protein
MRYTLDTNILKIRDVFAMNHKTGDFIQYDSFPVIGNDGLILWKTPLEFLAGISCLNTTALQLLESIQPGFSTLSTNFTRGRDRMLASTVNGVGNSYISSSFLNKKCIQLSIENGYISTTTFYDCLAGLPELNTITQSIGPMIMFLQANGSNYNNSGYVSTIHPGKFHNYYSTLGFTGGLNNVNIDSGIQSLSLDFGGFELLNSSKMRLDINANVSVTYTNPPQPESIVTTFSTFLHNGTRPVGTPVVVNYSNLNFEMSRFTYFLTAADIGTSLNLRHRITNIDNTNAKITVFPTSVSARLINMD